MPIYYFNITAKKRISGGLIVLFAAAWAVALTGCRDLFEKDISEEKLKVIIPTSNDTLSSNQVHFKWEEMDGASFYNLQIVQSSFSDITTFTLDTNVNESEFYHVLNPGDYEFRLRGENGAYISPYAGPYKIYVDSVSDLSEQSVSLVSPSDGIYQNGTEDVFLSWQNLFAATSYEYILKIGDSFDVGSVLDVQGNIATLSYNVPLSFFDVEGTYFWGIRGVNLTSTTPYTFRSLFIDFTAPNVPDLTLPADESFATVDVPVVFKWSTGDDPGDVNSPVYSTVEISDSETFDDPEIFEGITVDSLSYTFSLTGDYWWRVKALDAAGNESETYSEERLITIE